VSRIKSKTNTIIHEIREQRPSEWSVGTEEVIEMNRKVRTQNEVLLLTEHFASELCVWTCGADISYGYVYLRVVTLRFKIAIAIY